MRSVLGMLPTQISKSAGRSTCCSCASSFARWSCNTNTGSTWRMLEERDSGHAYTGATEKAMAAERHSALSRGGSFHAEARARVRAAADQPGDGTLQRHCLGAIPCAVPLHHAPARPQLALFENAYQEVLYLPGRNADAHGSRAAQKRVSSPGRCAWARRQ